MGVGNVPLQARQVGSRKAAGLILASRQPGNGADGVERIECVVEPGSALLDRAREVRARRPVVQMQPILRTEAGNEVRPAEPPVVVSHLCLDIDNAGRTFAFGGRETAGVPFEGLDGIDVQPGVQPARRGIRNIEPIQSVVRLRSIAAIEMNLARIVENCACHEGKGVPVVLRGGVRDIQNLLAVQRLGVRSLLRGR